MVAQFLRRTDPIPHASGHFSYAYRFVGIDSIAFDVAAGATASVDLTSTTGKHALHLLPSTGRTLPTHSAHDAVNGRVFGASVGLLTNSAYANSVELLTGVDVPVLFMAQGHMQLPRVRLAYGSHVADELPLSPPGASPAVAPLGRIDAQKVAVTMPDGTTTMVDGTFAVLRGNDSLMSGLSLGHGVDVVSGTYAVRVSYRHPVDGASLTETFAATLP